MSGTILLLGGRSEIGVAVAERLVRAGNDTVILAARRSAELADEVARLKAAGAKAVWPVEFDADDTERHGPFLDELIKRFGTAAIVITAFGILGDQSLAERDPQHALAIVHTDYTAHVSMLTHLAARMRAAGAGTLIVFSSVAGVRVRRANYVYGSAKAGLDGFASGLADSLAGTGARLLLVRPGFVIGRMTAGMRPAPLSSTPDQVADATVKALRRGRGEVWVPGALRLLFAGMRMLPRPIWRRLPR